jgi:hypothetical protein
MENPAERDRPRTLKITVDAIVSDTPDFSLNQERFPGRFKPVTTKRFEFTGRWNLAPSTTTTTTTLQSGAAGR